MWFPDPWLWLLTKSAGFALILWDSILLVENRLPAMSSGHQRRCLQFFQDRKRESKSLDISWQMPLTKPKRKGTCEPCHRSETTFIRKRWCCSYQEKSILKVERLWVSPELRWMLNGLWGVRDSTPQIKYSFGSRNRGLYVFLKPNGEGKKAKPLKLTGWSNSNLYFQLKAFETGTATGSDSVWSESWGLHGHSIGVMHIKQNWWHDGNLKTCKSPRELRKTQKVDIKMSSSWECSLLLVIILSRLKILYHMFVKLYSK